MKTISQLETTELNVRFLNMLTTNKGNIKETLKRFTKNNKQNKIILGHYKNIIFPALKHDHRLRWRS